MTSRGEPAAEKSFKIVKRKKMLQKYRRGRFAVAKPPRERSDCHSVGVTKQVKGEPVSFRRQIRLYHILQKDLLNEKRRARIYLTRRFCFVTTVMNISLRVLFIGLGKVVSSKGIYAKKNHSLSRL